MVGSMQKDGGAMSLEDFARLAEIWGGDIAQWPEADQAGARALLAVSADAAAILESEAQLDAALTADPTPVVSTALTARLLADAAEVSAARPGAASVAPARAARSGFWSALQDFVQDLGGGAVATRLAGVATVAAAAGFALGLETQSMTANVTTTAATETIYVDGLMIAEDSESDGVFALSEEAEL